MKGFYVVCFCVLGLQIGVAQSSALGTWNSINLKYNQTERLSFFAEAQLRSLAFYDQFHYYEYKAAVNYKLHKAVRLTLGAKIKALLQVLGKCVFVFYPVITGRHYHYGIGVLFFNFQGRIQNTRSRIAHRGF